MGLLKKSQDGDKEEIIETWIINAILNWTENTVSYINKKLRYYT